MSISTKDIPLKKDMGKFFQIAFRNKSKTDGSPSPYITVQQQDYEYIMYWLQRFLADASSHSQSETWVWKGLNSETGLEDLKLPDSGFFSHPSDDKRKAPNSIISYVGGLLSNSFRSNADLNQKQLKALEGIFNDIIVKVYEEVESFTPGYDYNTRIPIEGPKRIRFKLH